MPSVIVAPNEKEIRLIQEMYIPLFLNGECLAFAQALHRGLGWPIMGLMRDDRIVHAAVKRPDGAFHDARGIVERDDLGQPFEVSPPLDIRPLREDELCRSSRKHEIMIKVAGNIAFALWPDLPWREDSAVIKMITFVNALEKLCKEHQCSLWGVSETHPIIVSPAVGDEAGYTLKPLASSVGFALERRLR